MHCAQRCLLGSALRVALCVSAHAAVGSNYPVPALVLLVLCEQWMGPRNATGHMTNNPITFPEGIAGLTSILHAKGFKFGIYSAYVPPLLHHPTREALECLLVFPARLCDFGV